MNPTMTSLAARMAATMAATPSPATPGAIVHHAAGPQLTAIQWAVVVIITMFVIALLAGARVRINLGPITMNVYKPRRRRSAARRPASPATKPPRSAGSQR